MLLLFTRNIKFRIVYQFYIDKVYKFSHNFFCFFRFYIIYCNRNSFCHLPLLFVSKIWMSVQKQKLVYTKRWIKSWKQKKGKTPEQVKKITSYLKKSIVTYIFWINFKFKFHWAFFLLQLSVVDIEGNYNNSNTWNERSESLNFN